MEYELSVPVPVAERSKAWVCGRSPAEIVGSNPTGSMDVFLLSVLCVLSGRGLCDELITRSEESYWLWSVVVCDLETSIMRRPWPSGGSLSSFHRHNGDDTLPNKQTNKHELSVVCSGLKCVPSFIETRSAVLELKVVAGRTDRYFVHHYTHCWLKSVHYISIILLHPLVYKFLTH